MLHLEVVDFERCARVMLVKLTGSSYSHFLMEYCEKKIIRHVHIRNVGVVIKPLPLLRNSKSFVLSILLKLTLICLVSSGDQKIK